jgi:energy-coupling factor transporter ATP-binding protein EcfA2
MSYHGLFLGETGSGKTTLARACAGVFRRSGIGVLAHIPAGVPPWPEADRCIYEPGRFIETANLARRCAIFIEMADASVSKYNEDFTKLATWARNLGHRCFFIAQRHTQINPTIRDQCGHLWLFRVGVKTASILAEEFVDPALEQAPDLADWHYLLKKRGVPATVHRPA